ncbi:hypothetical protein ACROYT_G013945 [Oculina patagonica]
MTGYTNYEEERVLPAIIPVSIEGQVLWAYLDTGSARNFISREAVKMLKLKPTRHETREILTVNGTKVQSMDGKSCEEIEFTGSKLVDFTTVRRPGMNQLKLKYSHTQDKRFYMTSTGEHQIHLILGDSIYSRIRTERVFKGKRGEPLVEETLFGWVVHGGDEYGSGSTCMYLREVNDYEKLYSLDVLGVEDRGENDQLDILRDFKESVVRREDGRYEREEYGGIIEEQLKAGVIEEAPRNPTGERVFYMPHKPVVKQSAVTMKVRMVFDASAKPHPLANSINDCMFTGPPLQPLLWDIMVRARMSTNLLLGDIEKAFLQISVKEEDRDSFRFLFNAKGEEKHLRFTRVPFGVEASPFLLGATLQHHFEQQGPEISDTVSALKENTYVDNLMQTGGDNEKLVQFKEESTVILESAKFPVHKWESNVKSLESESMPNPSKILGHTWNKEDDTLELPAKPFPHDQPVTKRTILSYLGTVLHDFTLHLQKLQFKKKGWNAEVSTHVKNRWLKWTKQLKDVRIPRSVATSIGEMEAVHLHIFADASILASCAVAIAVVEQVTANMAKNISTALQRWPIKSTTIWMDSMVALYWITNPGKGWKVFVANRVKKIAETTGPINITWKYCPSEMNLADLGSRGATIVKMEKGNWFTGPDWPLDERQWPQQPRLNNNKATDEEFKATQEAVLCTDEYKFDEWDALLERSTYWRTLRVTAWVLRPYGVPSTSALLEYRTEGSRPFEVTGVDFAGPFSYKVGKKEQGKCYLIIFTCASSRAVHLEVTRTQTADEFKQKLNAFISRRTRPRIIISDNAKVFKTTADWIKTIRKSEKLQDYLARENIRWQFNLAKSPWWGGFYERLIKEIKKAMQKTLGRSHLSYEAFESVIMDVERNLNNRPLTEADEDDAKAHVWKRWKREYVHSLMESHRLNKETGATPKVGEIVLVVGDEKNRGEWKKGKVVRLVQGKDGVVRGVTLFRKGHTIERPLQLVRPLEIRAVEILMSLRRGGDNKLT